MGLVAPNNLREKLLVIGPPKAGKSTAILSIVYWMWKSGDPHKAYLIDADDSLEVLLTDPKYAGMDNYELFPVSEWEDWTAASEKVRAAGEGDWIGVDMADKAWRSVQSYFLREVRKKSRAEALLDASKKGKTGWEAFRDDFDWPTINALYDDTIKPILLSSRAHLIFTTEQDEVRSSGNMTEEQKRSVRDFGKFKPTGQKSLPYQMRTILRIDRLARGRIISTLGDRARPELDNEDLDDFFDTYLRKIAGWNIELPKGAKSEAVDTPQG